MVFWNNGCSLAWRTVSAPCRARGVGSWPTKTAHQMGLSSNWEDTAFARRKSEFEPLQLHLMGLSTNGMSQAFQAWGLGSVPSSPTDAREKGEYPSWPHKSKSVNTDAMQLRLSLFGSRSSIGRAPHCRWGGINLRVRVSSWALLANSLTGKTLVSDTSKCWFNPSFASLLACSLIGRTSDFESENWMFESFRASLSREKQSGFALDGEMCVRFALATIKPP